MSNLVRVLVAVIADDIAGFDSGYAEDKPLLNSLEQIKTG
jgi:hypothetical protein